jgi:hypothetical protein
LQLLTRKCRDFDITAGRDRLLWTRIDTRAALNTRRVRERKRPLARPGSLGVNGTGRARPRALFAQRAAREIDHWKPERGPQVEGARFGEDAGLDAVDDDLEHIRALYLSFPE